MSKTTSLAVVMFAGIAPTIASADPLIEVGATTGIHFYSENSELGVPNGTMQPTQQNALPLGLRGGAFWFDHYGVEAELALMPTVSRIGSFGVATLTYRVQAVYQHDIPLLNHVPVVGEILPFAVAGFGAMSVVATSAPESIDYDTDLMLFVGGGGKYQLFSGWGVRGDVRWLFPPSSVDNSVTSEFELLGSIYKEFGRQAAATVVVDKDSDGDGLLDSEDSCEQQPEDKDGFDDHDGCPELDNDNDGVADTSDTCKDIPEDKDGFEDTDGCPDTDNDKDEIVEPQDKCPNEAEDKDGFADEDGCPDFDNDSDGITDSVDKCVGDPETANGFDDSDGCPDEVPPEVQKLVGVLAGVTFKTGTADLDRKSNKALDAVVTVLQKFPRVTLEIAAHTDNKPQIPKSKFADAMELSKARAEAVKAYLVGKGVAEDHLVTVGFGDTKPVQPIWVKGSALEKAQAANRRIELNLVVQGASAAPAAAPAATPAPAPTATPAPAPTPTPTEPTPAPTPKLK